MGSFLRALMCDDKGELLNLSDDDLTDIPVGLLQDIMRAVQEVMYGEKKS